MSVLVPSIYITLLQRFAEAGFFTYTENIDRQYIHAKSEVFYNQHFDLLLSLIDNQAQVADSLSVIQRESYALPSFLEVFNSHIDALAEDYIDLSFQYKGRYVFYLGDLHACSLNRSNDTSVTCHVVKNLADLEVWASIQTVSQSISSSDYCQYLQCCQRLNELNENVYLVCVMSGDCIVNVSALMVDGYRSYGFWNFTPLEYRRQGYGFEGYLFRLSLAKKLGCKFFCALCSPQSASFQEKLGFKPVAIIDQYAKIN